MTMFYRFCTILALLFCFDHKISAEISQHNLYPIQPYTESINIIGRNLNHRELIIQIRANSSLDDLKSLSKSFGLENLKPVFNLATPAGQHTLLNRYYILQFPINTKLEQVIQMYSNSPMIEKVEVNRINRFCADSNPNDPRYVEQWNLRTINLPQAWNIETGDSSVIVAVVDSGIKKEHPEFKNQLWQNSDEIPFNETDDDKNGYIDDIYGWDFSDAPTLQGVGDSTQRDNDPDDETGHGTHVSGIIAADTNNGIGIAGIAWGCKIMPLRAGFRLAGGGAFLQNDDVAAAIVYAADNGANVINLSLGDTVNAFIIQDAVEYAYNKGCILIAAAGNSAEPGAYYPAALNNVLSVASLDNNLHLGSSNFGSSVDIAAPGEDILSTDIVSKGNGFAIRSGTSMATAHVSGVAALLIASNPSCNNLQVKQWLIGTAEQLSVADLVGAGIVNAFAALTEEIDLTARISNVQIPDRSVERRQGFLDIVGTASGSEFTHFWLDYGLSETPDLWFPIDVPQTEPKYNTILQRWIISELDDGTYTLRLSTKAKNGKTIRDKMVVEIRNIAPNISKHESGIWLSSNKFDSTIIWQTDVLTKGVVEVFVNSNKNRPVRIASSDSTNLQHIVHLSEAGLPSGEYLYKLKSINRSGLTHIDDNEKQLYRIIVSDDQINQYHLKQTFIAQLGLHGIATTLDINNNGKIEIIGVSTESTQTTSAHIIELDDNMNLKKTDSLDQHISRIWDTADTDGDGLYEILCSSVVQSITTTFLLEQPSPTEHPSQRIWGTDEIWGGIITDMDLDGKPEIYSRHDADNSIWVYESIEDNALMNIAKLENPTNGNNAIGTKFATGDFDGDGLIEIVAGDNDGDVFIYENIGDNLFEQTWVGVLPDSIPLLFAAGDMDGDGISEFTIGAKVWTVGIDLPRQHWLFTIYKADSNDSYKPVWHKRIRELQDGDSGITIADANNDGRCDLSIAIPPNFYLIQFDGISYQPIWHHAAASTFNPIVADINADGKNELLFNANNTLTGFENNFDNDLRKPSTTDVSVNDAQRPRLISATHNNPKQIILLFDRQMGSSARYPSHYRLKRTKNEAQINNNTDEFTPQSAILDRSAKRVVLTFSTSIFSPDYSYEIETYQLSDINGIMIAEDRRKMPVEYIPVSIAYVSVYPNPAKGHQVIFDKLPSGSNLHIYDVNGNCIAFLRPEDDLHTASRCRKIWSLKNVSSGIYIYVLESDLDRKIGKISVLK